ncbi:MAG: hypothetical protein H0X34_13310 [Chthoniobacterales bacterium]|nr:hypothetical protein [Chthoniobacterales bacterium]
MERRSSPIQIPEALTGYLAAYFCSLDDLAYMTESTVAQIEKLIANGFVPRCSYEITSDRQLVSFVFGSIPGASAPMGRYFALSNAVWIRRALALSKGNRLETAQAQFEARFKKKYLGALRARSPRADTAETNWQDQLGNTLKHFRAGTYGLCVRDCVSVDRIARKQTVVEQLERLTAGGTRHDFDASEAREVRLAIIEYNAIAMPFSPLDYSLSSRKRLVADLLPFVLPNGFEHSGLPSFQRTREGK